jgi:hypothetical protein
MIVIIILDPSRSCTPYCTPLLKWRDVQIKLMMLHSLSKRARNAEYFYSVALSEVHVTAFQTSLWLKTEEATRRRWLGLGGGRRMERNCPQIWSRACLPPNPCYFNQRRHSGGFGLFHNGLLHPPHSHPHRHPSHD